MSTDKSGVTKFAKLYKETTPQAKHFIDARWEENVTCMQKNQGVFGEGS